MRTMDPVFWWKYSSGASERLAGTVEEIVDKAINLHAQDSKGTLCPVCVPSRKRKTTYWVGPFVHNPDAMSFAYNLSLWKMEIMRDPEIRKFLSQQTITK